MFKKIGLFLLAVVVVLAVVVATRPAHFSIQRSATMQAPAEVGYGYVSDLHQFQQWSPWEKLDPAMTTSFAGPSTGVSSSYSWKGNDKVGEGKMTIKELRAPEYVAIDLDFLAPMKMTNLTEFKLKPAAEGVAVTWTMSGDNGFVGKAFSMVMDMDKEVGKDFEGGLSQLKTLSEAEAKRRADAQRAAAALAAAKAAPPPAPAPVPVATAPAPKPKHRR